jgi:hypothetical protein
MRKTAHGLGAGFQQLEDRTLPATAFGISWPDPGHLTLSFAPDGTATPLGGSSLYQTMAPAGPATAWQREVLRAFQSWAAVTNVNVGLVTDSGLPFGTSGAVQGDGRFGDVRVGAGPLSTGEVAGASPFSWTGTTYSGDVQFGSGRPYRIGKYTGTYDVFSIAAHEAGHSLGLDHSTAAGSVMNEAYAYHTGLSASDVAAIQALYGVRAPDQYDAAGGNDTAGKATPLPATGLGSFQLRASGDLSTLSDVDYYKFSVLPLAGLTGGVVVRLKAAGLSLLLPRVTVTDAFGRVVASGASLDPQNNDVTLRFNPSLLGGTYYVRVEGATGDVFGIGSYQLAVDGLTANAVLSPIMSVVNPLLDLHLNDTLAAATNLLPIWGNNPPDQRFDYTYRGAIEDGKDTDYYRVHSRAATGTAPMNLNVLVWGLDASPLDPRVHVYDAAGNPVAFQVLANEAGVMSVQVLGVTPGADYYVQVSARNPGGANGTGGYFLGADFNQLAPTTYDGVAADALNPGDKADTGKLSIADAGVFQFALSADLLGAGAGGVTLTVTDGAGNVVLTLSAAAGQPAVTAVRYLAAGAYTLRYSYTSPTGATAASIAYGLFLLKLSDGVGPYATTSSTSHGTTSSGGSSGGGADTGYTYVGSSGSNPDGYGYYF